MKTRWLWLCLLAVATGQLGNGQGEERSDYRAFTDAFGQKGEARIVMVENGQVYLEARDGGKMSLSVKALPEDEQEAVEEWLKAGGKMPAGSNSSPPPKQPPPAGQPSSIPEPKPQQTQWAPGVEDLYLRFRKLNDEGNYAEAIPVAKKLVEACEQHYGPEHPNTATSLGILGWLYSAMGRYGEAEPLLERALKITEKALGPDRPSTATSLNDLASLYNTMGRFAEAEPLFERALKIREKALGPDHLETATSLNNLAILYRTMSRYGEAEPLYERALKIREKALGPDHPDTALSLNNLAVLYEEMGRYGEAETLFERALEIRDKALGPDHPSTATSLNNLAFLYNTMGRYGEAEPLYERALKIQEKALRPDHPDTAASLDNLAGLYSAMGRYAEAESLYERALKIKEKVLGPDHPDAASSLSSLAFLYKTMGRYGEAEPLYERALKIQEKALRPDHPDTAASLDNLAGLYSAMGRYAEAESLYERALKITEKALGPDHPDMASSLSNLASLYNTMGRSGEAEPLFERALKIKEKVLGPDHPDTASSLNNLAWLYDSMGRYEEAEPLFERALKITEKVLGPDHPSTATSLNNLAWLYKNISRSGEAEPLFERALKIQEKALGPDHPRTASSLNNLAMLRFDMNQREGALDLVQRELSARNAILERVLAFTGESERLEFQKTLFPFDLIASLDAAPETADTVLRNKGVVLESVLEDRQVVAAAGTDSALVVLTTRIRDGKAKLRRALLEGNRSGLSREEIAALGKDVQTLEKELARSVASLGGARQSLSLKAADVAGSLPADAALVEYFRYGHYLGKLKLEFSYGAVVVRRGRKPALVLCGKAEVIEAQIATARNGIEKAIDELVEESSRGLHDALIKPLAPHLDGVTRLIVSPDAQLNFVSFATLLDADGRFVAEAYELHYVAGGRDLLKEGARLDGGAAVLVGGPAFRESTPKEPTDAGSGQQLLTGEVRSGLGDDVASINLAPLPGAERETERVWQALGKAAGGRQMLTGASATEAEVRRIRSPKVLHLATHGFFLKDIEIANQNQDPARGLSAGGRDEPGDWLKPRGPIHNPMYRSGIALAGAQTTFEKWRQGEVPDPNNDGILMAAEVVDLDLRGTDLVTLSACGTATGEALSGEGVLGLRRAFVMAGTKNLLMTLWPVADEETADFMEDFYQRYAETGNAPKALADVQREWLVRLREERGLVYAVNRAGAFIMSSQGSIDDAGDGR